MSMKTILKCLIFISLLLSHLNAYAEDNLLSEKAKTLESLLNQFSEMCIDSKGNILNQIVIIDQAAATKNGATINCNHEAIRLANMIEEIKKEANTSKNASPTSTSPVENYTCFNNQNRASPQSSISILKSSEEITNFLNKDQCNRQSSKDCFSDIGCNILRPSVCH